MPGHYTSLSSIALRRLGSGGQPAKAKEQRGPHQARTSDARPRFSLPRTCWLPTDSPDEASLKPVAASAACLAHQPLHWPVRSKLGRRNRYILAYSKSGPEFNPIREKRFWNTPGARRTLPGLFAVQNICYYFCLDGPLAA